MTINRPKVFISSTIYDFRDLRSALKYYLESLGYEVMMSDFNDFTKKLDLNSFKACLDTINQMDYFILLVGSRVGGFYDAVNKISITQMEYRTAYERAKNRKLKLISFVRKELWDIREDRKALKSYLLENFKSHREISEEEINLIVNHPSNLVNDAEFLFGFLNEIGRKEEMHKATQGISDFPKANWIHTFSGFKDIIDALRGEFKFADNLSIVALKENLKHELVSNLILLSEKLPDGGDIFFHKYWAESSRRCINGDYDSISQIPSRYLFDLSIYCFFGVGVGKKLSVQFIDQALTSGFFLEYNIKSDRYQIGLIHQELINLKQNIVRLKQIENVIKDKALSLHVKFRTFEKSDKPVPIKNSELIDIFAAYDCQSNIISLSIATYKAVEGDAEALKNMELLPSSPLQKEAANIERETPTKIDIINFIKSSGCVHA